MSMIDLDFFSSGGWESKIRCQHGQVSEEGNLSGLWTAASCYSLLQWRKRERERESKLSGDSSYKDTNAMMDALDSWHHLNLTASQGLYLLCMGIRSATWNVERHRHPVHHSSVIFSMPFFQERVLFSLLWWSGAWTWTQGLSLLGKCFATWEKPPVQEHVLFS
jgi:hypothetical protein